VGEALAHRAREGLDRRLIRRLVRELATPVDST
jgi:predicted secreted protein